MADLRSFVYLDSIQPQFAAFLGTICKGFLMDQDKRRLPSMKLRLSILHHGIGVDYLDSLKCKSPLYNSIQEMAEANYPETFGPTSGNPQNH